MDTEVTVSSSTPEPEAPAAPPAPPPPTQVVALETAGIAELARSQGEQKVTLDALAGIVSAQGAELAELRARQTATAAAVVEVTAEPEPEPESEVTEIAAAEIMPPSTPDESSSPPSVPRRERGLLARMLLGKLP